MNKAEILNEIIRNRRSIFPQQFTGERIDDGIINQLLENANWAPTHKITEPWRFCVFTENGLKKLADFQSKYYQENTLTEDFLQNQFDKLANKPLECSHIISIGVSLENRNSLPEIEEIEAVACAVQNILLSAEAYDLGAYWGSGSVTYKKEVNPFFGLEKNDLLVGFVFLGIPKQNIAQQGKRTPIADKVRWVREN